jgi:hypothetical protein
MAGLFDNLFGAPGGMYADMLSPEQQAQIRRQSMMQMAAKLLEGSGPSPVRRTLGQNIGSALGAGAEAVQSGQTNAVQQMLLKQKLDEAKLTAKQREDFTAMLTGLGTDATTQPAAPLTPSQALLAPAGGRTGPTPQNAAMIGQRMPAQAALMAGSTSPAMPASSPAMPASSPAAQQSVFQMLSPQQRQLIAAQGPVEGSKTLLNMTQEAMKFGEAKPMSLNGQTVMVETNPFGQRRVVQGAQPYEALPTDIRGTEYVYGQPLAGTGSSGMARLGQYGTATKPPSNVVLPAGPNQFVTGAGTLATKRLESGLGAAEAANNTLRNIDMIVPALDTAVLGPAADYRTTMLRVGQQLGIAGANAEQTLASTRQVVQGLARSEMDAAAGMKGQGEISQSERALIGRTAAGDQSMTSGELRTAMAAMQKLANQRLKSYQGLLQTSQTIPGFQAIAPMFQVDPYQSQFDLGGNLRSGTSQGLGNAVQQELDRRRTSGGAR